MDPSLKSGFCCHTNKLVLVLFYVLPIPQFTNFDLKKLTICKDLKFISIKERKELGKFKHEVIMLLKGNNCHNFLHLGLLACCSRAVM